MGDAYTPGLTVTGSTVVRKSRRLPLAGTVVAEVGQRVKAHEVVARTHLPGRVYLLNFANHLGVLPDELEPGCRDGWHHGKCTMASISVRQYRTRVESLGCHSFW
jgi:hypothetical protein